MMCEMTRASEIRDAANTVKVLLFSARINHGHHIEGQIERVQQSIARLRKLQEELEKEATKQAIYG